ncbi:MAG: flippase-like domain-containing protein [Planctomycetales bacterium]|nr:flippase-like domain-containing protein [Planctomycetales bacterium]MCA9169313.1 flippase-like domain-containing protein [Planctomycetales bacterium]
MNDQPSGDASTRRFIKLRQGDQGAVGRWIVAILLTIGTLTLLISMVDTSALAARARLLDWSWTLGSFGFVSLGVVCRALRLQWLTRTAGNGPSLKSWTYVASVHQLLFTTLPSGLGDIGFPVLVARTSRIPVTRGALLLIVYRLQDFALLLATLSFALAANSQFISARIVFLTIGVFGAAISLAVTVRFLQRLAAICSQRLRPLEHRRLIGKFVRAIEALDSPAAKREADCDVTIESRLLLALLTAATWACAVGNYSCLFRFAGLPLPMTHLMLIVGGLNLCGALAAFAIGGIGIGETALTGLLFALGHPMAEAVSVSLIVRPAALISILMMSGIMAGLCVSPHGQAEEVKSREDGCPIHTTK